MATIRDILGDDTLKFENNFKKQGLQGKDLENAMIKLARDTRTQRENEQKQLQEQKNQVAEGYANDFNSLFMGDNASSQVLRGLATGGNRLLAGANYLADKVGFDLLDNKTTNNLNEMQNLFDKKKEDISRENVSPERLAELQKLDTNNQNATGIIDNLSAGVSTMVDTLTHPSEWTLQGVTETVTDPLNALSFGAGSLASKLGRTMLQKTAFGATGGAIEGATVNAGGEYIIAKGQDKTDNEASKIALQGLGGGVVAGGAFGAIGGAVSGYTPQVKEKLDSIKSKSVDEILDNELLKDLDSVQGEIINPEINSSYPKVDDKFKIEQAGQTPPPTPPNFRMVYDNLPSIFTPEQIDKIDTRMNDFAVQEQFKIESIFPEIKENYTPNFRFVSDKLPSILRELVDTEIIDEPTAKQIEYKNKTILLGHKDIIYAGMNGWKESVNQSIIDAINGNKISKMKRTEDISNQATLQSQQLAKTLAEQGADATTIKDTINNKIIPTKDELDFTNILNDGMPVENRFAGARLRNAIQRSISNPVRTPEQFASILKSAGFNDGVVKIATQSYINKNLDSFDDYITSKISKTNDEQIKAITKKIDDEIIITEDNLQEWLKANPVIKNDTPEMSYRNAVDELQNILNKSSESITDENLTKFIKDRYGDDGIKLHKNFTKQVELESKADDLHNTILDIEDEIASLKDEKDSIADNPNATKEDIANYDKEILKLEKEVQNLSKQKASFDNKIQDLVGESFQIEKAVTIEKYPEYVNGSNRIDYDKLKKDGLSTLTYEDIYREIKKDYTDIENLPDDKKEFIKSISYGGRLEKAKKKVEKYYGMLTKEQQEALINKTKANDKQSNNKVETTQKEKKIKKESAKVQTDSVQSPKPSKIEIEPNAHKGIDIRGLTELQKEERRVFRSQSEEIKNKIMNNDYEFKDGELIKGDTKIKVHDNLLEYAEQMQKEKIERIDYESRYTKYEALKGIDKDITYQEGLNAHRGTSFSPEQRARTEIASYIEDITSTYESLLKFADTPEKIEILDNEFSRFKEGYLKRKKVVLARRSNVVSSMIAGPANFPVRKMEKANNAVDNAMKEFYEYRDKAFTAISKKLRGQDANIIKSNDADAISKLQDKLSKLESNHEMMKKANEVMRDKKLDTTQKYNKLKELGFSDKNIKNDIAPYGKFPQFSLTNNLQNIRTVKQRIVQLSKEKTIADNGGTKDILYKGARIHENFTDKRVQIFFDDIPNADIRTELKKRGFKWSPTSKAWQRSLGSDSKRYAQDALNNHFEKIENKTNFDETTANRYLKDEPTAMEKMENSIKNLEEC